jgi:phosphate starvation-inducible protein PhoH and related proteins
MVQAVIIELPNPDSAMALAGEQESNLKTLSQQTGAKLLLRGQELNISGTEAQVNRARQMISLLKDFWHEGRPISDVDILAVSQALNTHQEDEWKALQDDVIVRTRRGESIRARTFRQRQYIKAIRQHAITFGIGPAGTGKTFLAALLAVKALLDNEYERLILTRPAVEAGEKLGFLPGDLQQKVNPYLRPLYDALYELIEPDRITSLMERGVIEVAPLAYMRGRTLNNAFVILDEAQNTTPAQMKMMLTRIGMKSRMVVTGDLTQTDLPPNQPSGLAIARKILEPVEGISFCYLAKGDIVRHPLVEKIIDAYERYETVS